MTSVCQGLEVVFTYYAMQKAFHPQYIFNSPGERILILTLRYEEGIFEYRLLIEG